MVVMPNFTVGVYVIYIPSRLREQTTSSSLLHIAAQIALVGSHVNKQKSKQPAFAVEVSTAPLLS